jgi:hypothetical protein
MMCGSAAHYCGKPPAYRREPSYFFFNEPLEPAAFAGGLQRLKKGSNGLSEPERLSLSAIMSGRAAKFSHCPIRILPVAIIFYPQLIDYGLAGSITATAIALEEFGS